MEKKEMLEMLINHYDDGNQSSFARRLGVVPQIVSNWLYRGKDFNLELVYQKCENVSAHWLLSRGDGEIENSNIAFEDANKVKELESAVEERERTISVMQQHIDTLLRSEKRMEREIELLESQLGLSKKVS